MTLRTGKTRLHRICAKCGKSFEPMGGRENRICEDCKPQIVNGFIAKILAFEENKKRRKRNENIR